MRTVLSQFVTQDADKDVDTGGTNTIGDDLNQCKYNNNNGNYNGNDDITNDDHTRHYNNNHRPSLNAAMLSESPPPLPSLIFDSDIINLGGISNSESPRISRHAMNRLFYMNYSILRMFEIS